MYSLRSRAAGGYNRTRQPAPFDAYGKGNGKNGETEHLKILAAIALLFLGLVILLVYVFVGGGEHSQLESQDHLDNVIVFDDDDDAFDRWDGDHEDNHGEEEGHEQQFSNRPYVEEDPAIKRESQRQEEERQKALQAKKEHDHKTAMEHQQDAGGEHARGQDAEGDHKSTTGGQGRTIEGEIQDLQEKLEKQEEKHEPHTTGTDTKPTGTDSKPTGTDTNTAGTDTKTTGTDTKTTETKTTQPQAKNDSPPKQQVHPNKAKGKGADAQERINKWKERQHVRAQINALVDHLLVTYEPIKAHKNEYTFTDPTDGKQWIYSTLDDIDKNSVDPVGCQTDALRLPNGWKLAPDDTLSKEIISKSEWGTQAMIVVDPTQNDPHIGSIAYSTANQNPNAEISVKNTRCLEAQDGSYFKPSACALRVLIRREKSEGSDGKETGEPSIETQLILELLKNYHWRNRVHHAQHKNGFTHGHQSNVKIDPLPDTKEGIIRELIENLHHDRDLASHNFDMDEHSWEHEHIYHGHKPKTTV